MQIKNLLYDVTMDCYQPNGGDAYSAEIADMLGAEMDLAIFQQQDDCKQSMSFSSTLPPVHMVQDAYSNGIQSFPGVEQQMQDYDQAFSPCSLPSKASKLEAPASTLDWLQPMTNGLQHPNANPNPAMMMDTQNPLANDDQSVHNPNLTATILSLPNNVQISGGNVNYVSMPSMTQQVYITSTTASMTSHSQRMLSDPTESEYRSRSNSSSSYILSPSSAPTSTVPDNQFPKPAYSYSCLIALALKNSPNGSLPVAEIYSFMMRHFPYFKTAPDGWKNSVRHNLSLNKCFEKIENPNADGTNSRKGCLWALNPVKVKKMDEEIFKWNKKDPLAIKRAMVHPEVLEMLSKGQESFSRNGIKCVGVGSHSRHSPLHSHHHHQPLHQMAHRQQSPSLSPSMRALNNVTTPMMVSTTSVNGLSCPISSSATQHLQSAPSHRHQHQHQHQHNKHHGNGNGTAAAANLFANGAGPLCLDSSLSDISIQNGLFEDLPQEFLEYTYSHSPSALLLSPKKASPAVSPAAEHTSETPSVTVHSGLPRGTLIPLGQN